MQRAAGQDGVDVCLCGSKVKHRPHSIYIFPPSSTSVGSSDKTKCVRVGKIPDVYVSGQCCGFTSVCMYKLSLWHMYSICLWTCKYVACVAASECVLCVQGSRTASLEALCTTVAFLANATEWCSCVRSSVILNVLKGKSWSRAGVVEGEWVWEVGEVQSYLIQSPSLLSPAACGAHGTIVDFNTMRSRQKWNKGSLLLTVLCVKQRRHRPLSIFTSV